MSVKCASAFYCSTIPYLQELSHGRVSAFGGRRVWMHAFPSMNTPFFVHAALFPNFPFSFLSSEFRNESRFYRGFWQRTMT